MYSAAVAFQMTCLITDASSAQLISIKVAISTTTDSSQMALVSAGYVKNATSGFLP